MRGHWLSRATAGLKKAAIDGREGKHVVEDVRIARVGEIEKTTKDLEEVMPRTLSSMTWFRMWLVY